MKVAMLHTEGLIACGGVAFYYDHIPVPGELLQASHATLKSGERPQQGTPFVCGNCMREIIRKDVMHTEQWSNGDEV